MTHPICRHIQTYNQWRSQEIFLDVYLIGFILGCVCRCGNVAAILELDENLKKQFRVFDVVNLDSYPLDEEFIDFI